MLYIVVAQDPIGAARTSVDMVPRVIKSRGIPDMFKVYPFVDPAVFLENVGHLELDTELEDSESIAPADAIEDMLGDVVEVRL
jgi:hypothetical protein